MTENGFNAVERALRHPTFGTLSTLSEQGRPHATGVVYAVSPKGGDLCFIRIRPDPTVFTYGIGISLWHNVRQPRDAIGRVKIRDDGLS